MSGFLLIQAVPDYPHKFGPGRAGITFFALKRAIGYY